MGEAAPARSRAENRRDLVLWMKKTRDGRILPWEYPSTLPCLFGTAESSTEAAKFQGPLRQLGRVAFEQVNYRSIVQLYYDLVVAFQQLDQRRHVARARPALGHKIAAVRLQIDGQTG